MKIVAIAGSTIPSDTANSIQVMKACNALVQLGHDLTLIVPDSSSRPSTFDLRQIYGISTSFPIEWLTSTNRRLFTWNAVRRALKLNPDLIYTWFPQSAVFGLLYKFPVVFEIHIHPTGLFGPAWHRAFATLRGRKRLASSTQALANLLERKHHIRFKPDEAVIAPNGVDLERFASLPDPVTARQKLGLPAISTVICTGHLYTGRGAELFLSLAKELPKAHFVWVGGRSEDVIAWKRRADAKKIPNVTFTGFVPNTQIPLYQVAADILLMPYGRTIMGSSGSENSASIASPMKMFEYMAAERAIVTSDLPVIREVLNEKNAVFCDPDDLASWKSALENLLNNASKRMLLGEQAGKDANGYTWLARAEKILKGL
ncbi:MAG: glycosyltransferase [Anaerolineaceae bacterium]|nr:MAG: glycosyltransferase [Anaerolineaceae bacterium]